MPRYKLQIEYCGTDYSGWQRQDGAPSIQHAIEEAVVGFCGQRASVYGAGRTDAGVHALGQVAHVDLTGTWATDRIRDAINAHLRPHKIAIITVEEVSETFDARFSALMRHYHYTIINRRPPLTVDFDLAWRVSGELDAEAMHNAAQLLVGHYDFTTFRSTRCQARSPLKTIDHLQVRRLDETIEVTCSARSFMHNQVRSFVGSLERVGCGKWSASDLQAALDAKDRTRCGPVAPACGLYLAGVDYPDATLEPAAS